MSTQGKFDSDYFIAIDDILRTKFGSPHIKPEEPTAALVRGILSQNTTDKNRDRAFDELLKRYPQWKDVASAPVERIADAVRVAGMANTRASRIVATLKWLAKVQNGKFDATFLLETDNKIAMEQLIDRDGIGMKTAAVFLLFNANAPFFPVDTHIKRVAVRLGIFAPKTTANKMIERFSQIVPKPVMVSLHINLIELGRAICTARKANCEICPVQKKCCKIGI
jgi:endonuclease III